MMTDHMLIDRLNEGINQILQTELRAGNEIQETWQGGFDEVSE